MNELINQDFRLFKISSFQDFSASKLNTSSRINGNILIPVDRQSRNSIFEINLERRGKILIVDDNHYNCESTKNILKKVLKEACSELEIIVGSDGADIIHYVIQDQSKGNEIKCIITDENMEYINGSDAIKIIRSLERLNKIKFVNIISLTGNEDLDSTNELLKAGAQAVFGKPLPKLLIAKALKDLNII